MNEVQKADPQARRRALVLIAVGAGVGAATIVVSRRLLPAASAWVAEDVAGRLPVVTFILSAIPTLPLAASGGWLWRFGSRVVNAGRFPPPGLRVVKDTPVFEGPTAVRRGQTLRAVGLALIVAALAGAVLLWRLLANLAGRA
jgi:hypothetical protein